MSTPCRKKTFIASIKHPQLRAALWRTDEILSQFTNYYTELYQSIPHDPERQHQFLQLANLPKLTLAQNELLTAEITPDEIQRVISDLKLSKSPGSDGSVGRIL